MAEEQNKSKKITINQNGLKILMQFALPNETPSDTNSRILFEYSKMIPITERLDSIEQLIKDKPNTQMKTVKTEQSLESKVLQSLKGSMNFYQLLTATGIPTNDLKLTLTLLIRNKQISKIGDEYRRSTNK